MMMMTTTLTRLSGIFLVFLFLGFSSAQESVEGLFDDIPISDDFLGSPDAPVTIIEYASMTCPHCKSFHERVWPSIKENYVDTGKVRFVVRPFPFDGDLRGEAAFMLAKCAPNGNYYGMLDILFREQSTWSDPQVRGDRIVTELLKLSKRAGFSESSFRSCLSRQDLLEQIIAGRNKAVEDFGVNSTPTIFINSTKFSGDLTPEGLSKAIDEAL